MTTAAPDPALDDMAGALSVLLGTSTAPARITGLTRVFGGNARQAHAFRAVLPDGRDLPCILLAQVAGKHVESDTASEYAVLRALDGSGVRAPAAIALDADGAIGGGPGLILERVAGIADAVEFLRQPDHGAGRELTLDLARATADLHRFDVVRSKLAKDGVRPVAAEIDRWQQSFARHRMEPHPVLDKLFDWLRQNAPEPARLSLVHGDLRPGNFLYQAGRVTALLDWEMAHPGDPAEDITWIYRDLWSPERFLRIEDFLAEHARQAGFEIPWRSVLYYRIFSEVKFATISLAAAHGFAVGHTQNLRLIDRAAKVPLCLALALDWIVEHDRGGHRAAA